MPKSSDRDAAASVLSAAYGSLLGAIVGKCAEEEGGVRAFARAVGLSRQTVYAVLKGRVPGHHAMRAIAAYLEVTAEHVAAWAMEP